MKKPVVAALAAICVLLSCRFLEAAVFTVRTASDSGPGSLRQAIVDANATPDLDLIGFNILGAGPHRISPLTPLPVITNSVVIDGYTQPGARPNTLPVGDNRILQIELHGANTEGSGLAIASQSENDLVMQRFYAVRGLAINSFTNGAGISVAQLAYQRGLILEGNFIGTDITGEKAFGNGVGISLSGTTLSTIGGTSPAARNVISGNWLGIAASASGWAGGPFWVRASVLGNYIGTDASGTRALGNVTGVTCSSAQGLPSAQITVGTGELAGANVVSGNRGTALEAGNRASVSALGNLIGVNAAGTALLPNQGNAVEVGNLSSAGVYGNIIAGNGGTGVMMPIGVVGGGVATVRSNFLYLNAQLGINILPNPFMRPIREPDNAVTLNDVGDKDGIPNFPEITGITGTGGRSVITGRYNSSPNIDSVLDFFRSASADPSGYGEGQIYLGSTTVKTGSSGNATFSWTAPESVAGQFVTATATPANSFTSEFSQAFHAPGVFAGNIEFASRAFSANRRYRNASIGIIRTDAGNACTVQVYTTNETAVAGVDNSAVAQTLHFAAGQTNQTLTIPLLPALLTGTPKSIGLVLTGPSDGAALGLVRRASLVLLDNVAPPTVSISDGALRSTNQVTFTVQLSRRMDVPVRVSYTTVDGTALASFNGPPSSTRYGAIAGDLSFAPGQLEKQITVNAFSALSPTDTFYVALFDPRNALLGNQVGGIGTPAPKIFVTSAGVLEWKQPPHFSWILETTSEFSDAGPWTALPEVISDSEGWCRYALPMMTKERAFYRLRQ